MSDQTVLTPEQAARWVALHGFTLYVVEHTRFLAAGPGCEAHYLELPSRLYFLWRAEESGGFRGQGWIVTKIGLSSDAFTDELTIEMLEQALGKTFERDLDPYWEPVPLHGEPHD